MSTNSEEARWRKYIVSTPDVLRGKPRIDGTRIPVALILGYLAAGKTYDEIISEFPDLKGEEIAACLDYARDLADYHVDSASCAAPVLPGELVVVSQATGNRENS